jgi:hypothetical protein
MILKPLQLVNKSLTSRDTFINTSTGELILRYPHNNNSQQFEATGYFIKNYLLTDKGQIECQKNLTTKQK